MKTGVKFVHFEDKPNVLSLFLNFCLLSTRFCREKHLLYKTPFEFWRQFKRGLSVVAFSGWRIVGHITLWHLLDDWYESGSIWVHPDFRHQGLGAELKQRLTALGHDFNVLSTTTNEFVKKMNRDLGIKEPSFWDLPAEIHQATCTCNPDKMQAENFCDCRLKDRDCRLFVVRAEK